jgi:hypothetical protein
MLHGVGLTGMFWFSFFGSVLSDNRMSMIMRQKRTAMHIMIDSAMRNVRITCCTDQANVELEHTRRTCLFSSHDVCFSQCVRYEYAVCARVVV